MSQQTAATSKYTATYAFGDDSRTDYGDVIWLIRETIAETQQTGLDIEFLGATREVDTAGHLVELTVRYEAVSKAAIAYLNWRAGLPASGSPQVAPADGTESDDHSATAEPPVPR